MTASKVHQCAPVIAGSTYAPLTIELRDGRTGLYLPMAGATVTVTIVDETTGEIIVEGAEALQSDANPYWVEYHLTDQQVARITTPSTWIAQWTLVAGNGKRYRVPTLCRIPVRPTV